MIGCCIARTASPQTQGVEDYPWQFFWLHIEGCIAVMMSSFTVFRTALGGFHSGSREDQDYHSLRSNLVRFYNRILAKSPSGMIQSSSNKKKSGSWSWRLPSIPRAKLTGLRTVFGLDLGLTERTMATDSEFDPCETDYHAFIRRPETSHEKISERPMIRYAIQRYESHSRGSGSSEERNSPSY